MRTMSLTRPVKISTTHRAKLQLAVSCTRYRRYLLKHDSKTKVYFRNSLASNLTIIAMTSAENNAACEKWRRGMQGALMSSDAGSKSVAEDEMDLPIDEQTPDNTGNEGTILFFPPPQSVISRLAKLVMRMQHKGGGVKTFKQHVRGAESNEKCPLSSSCSTAGVDGAFTPTAIVEWIMENLSLESHLEACHLVAMLCRSGFVYPCNQAWESHSIKINEPDDDIILRFQAPFYWISESLEADETDYVCHLYGRQNNSRGIPLNEYEQKYLTKIERMFRHKWEFIKKTSSQKQSIMAQVCASERSIQAWQEYAYWRVNRPRCYFKCTGGRINELWAAAIRGHNRMYSYVEEKHDEKTAQAKKSSPSKVVKMSCNRIVSSCAEMLEVDPLLSQDESYHNPWRGDATDEWPIHSTKETGPYKMQCKTWGRNFDLLLKDELGMWFFEKHLKKEFSLENLDFYKRCIEFKSAPLSQMEDQIKEIYSTFISPDAKTQINIDTQTLQKVQHEIKTNKSRFVFDPALDHIYTLMKKDSYKRFVKSAAYKEALAQAANPARQTKEKMQLPKIWRLSQFLPKKRPEDDL